MGSPALLDQTSSGGPTPCTPCASPAIDGITDVILKFNTQAVAAALGTVTDGQCIQVNLVTNLGTGSDFIRILKKK